MTQKATQEPDVFPITMSWISDKEWSFRIRDRFSIAFGDKPALPWQVTQIKQIQAKDKISHEVIFQRLMNQNED